MMIEILQPCEVQHAWCLSQAAGWNQTLDDWLRILAMDPNGSFAARRDGRLIGTVSTCRFGQTAWIAMMLVHEGWRGQGIGRALIQQALDYLDALNIVSIRLDATHFGEPLYQSLGFHRQFRLRRYAGRARGGPTAGSNIRRGEASDRGSIVALDAKAVSYRRDRLLDGLLDAHPNNCLVAQTNATVDGYLLWRPGRLAWMVGPCVAHPELGTPLVRAAMAELEGQEVYIDMPDDNRAAVSMITDAGCVPVRELQRMVRGEPSVEDATMLFASSGPEMG